MKLYANIITLVLFLILRIPSVFERLDMENPMRKKDKAAGSGMAAFISGAVMLTVFAWAGPSHMFEGNNWVNVLRNLSCPGARIHRWQSASHRSNR